MPELPEVETMRRGIASVVGRRIVRIDCPPCSRRPIAIRPSLQEIRGRTEGKTIASVERLGKRIVIWMTDNRGRSKCAGR